MELDKKIAPAPPASCKSSSSDDIPKSSATNDEPCRLFDQWVDYLPHHQYQYQYQYQYHDNDENGNNNNNNNVPMKSLDAVKRASLDATETNLTSSQEDMMLDAEDWPDSASLEDYAILPNALLVEHDPVLQHELLLSDPSVVTAASNETSSFTHNLQQVLEERRRGLMASMEASQRTRRCLEPHIKQRASLASVLQDIEGSYNTLRQHLVSSSSNNDNNNNDDNHPHMLDDVVVPMEEDEEELLASALDLEHNDTVVAMATGSSTADTTL